MCFVLIGYLYPNQYLNIFTKSCFYFLESYEFKHQGHCRDGFARPNSVQKKIEDCFSECASRPNIGYFAFNSKNGGCSCYLNAKGCPDDDKFNDHNAYRIIKGNRHITLTVFSYLKIFDISNHKQLLLLSIFLYAT